MKTWVKIQEFLSLKAKFIMTVFTLSIIAMCWTALLTSKKLDPQISVVYLAVVGFYSHNRITKIKVNQIEIESKGRKKKGGRK